MCEEEMKAKKGREEKVPCDVGVYYTHRRGKDRNQ